MQKYFKIETWDKKEFDYLRNLIIEQGYEFLWEHYPKRKNLYILHFWR
jgi:hypothetical protein